MSAGTTNVYRVLVGFDFSELGLLALKGGLRQVAHATNAELHAVGVVHRGGIGPFDGKADQQLASQVRVEVQRYVEEAVKTAQLTNVTVFGHARIGGAAKEIAALADEQNIDLVVVGTHGRHGIRRLVQGSVAEHVVRDAPCPVLVMRPKSTDAEKFAPEPPCPRCVAARESSNGQTMWCELHGGSHPDTHVYGGSAGNGGVSSWTLYNH